MAPALTNGQVIEIAFKAYERAAPSRDDIVAYIAPVGEESLWLARVVGVPGDAVLLSSNAMHLNGAPIRIPGRLQHYLPMTTNSGGSKWGEWKLERDQYFLLADNTFTGVDSRHFGPIPMANIEGRVFRK